MMSIRKIQKRDSESKLNASDDDDDDDENDDPSSESHSEMLWRSNTHDFDWSPVFLVNDMETMYAMISSKYVSVILAPSQIYVGAELVFLDGHVLLDMQRLMCRYPREGYGSSFLNQLIQMCDDKRVIIRLEPPYSRAMTRMIKTRFSSSFVKLDSGVLYHFPSELGVDVNNIPEPLLHRYDRHSRSNSQALPIKA